MKITGLFYKINLFYKLAQDLSFAWDREVHDRKMREDPVYRERYLNSKRDTAQKMRKEIKDLPMLKKMLITENLDDESRIELENEINRLEKILATIKRSKVNFKKQKQLDKQSDTIEGHIFTLSQDIAEKQRIIKEKTNKLEIAGESKIANKLTNDWNLIKSIVNQYKDVLLSYLDINIEDENLRSNNEFYLNKCMKFTWSYEGKHYSITELCNVFPEILMGKNNRPGALVSRLTRIHELLMLEKDKLSLHDNM